MSTSICDVFGGRNAKQTLCASWFCFRIIGMKFMDPAQHAKCNPSISLRLGFYIYIHAILSCGSSIGIL